MQCACEHGCEQMQWAWDKVLWPGYDRHGIQGSAVLRQVAEAWGSDVHVVIAGLANTYASYVTTFEEYSVQRYEGASTIFGPHTLDAYIQVSACGAPQAVWYLGLWAGGCQSQRSARRLEADSPVLKGLLIWYGVSLCG